MENKAYIRWFRELGMKDVPLVGGKTASLGELYTALTPKGMNVPNGFAVTAKAYRDALSQAGAWDRLRGLVEGLDKASVEELSSRAEAARALVYQATGTEEIRRQLAQAYRDLEKQYGRHVPVAVRSSATAEDLPNASFAGQHDSYINIRGEAEVFDACRRCFASLFTDRAIVYRNQNGFDHLKVALSVAIMNMVRSDKGASGVIFTLDTESGFRDVVLVTGSYGLGENIVQGQVDPDEFYVHKPTLRAGHRMVLRHTLGEKQVRMVFASAKSGATTINHKVSRTDRARYCLDDAEVLSLADYAILIEQHYSAAAGHPTPMDIEWAKDGVSGKLFIVQARPETVASRRAADAVQTYTLKSKGKVLVSGRAIGEKIASGKVRIVANDRRSAQLPARRNPGRRHHHPGLGAGDERGRRHRHQSGRAHVPCRDRRPRNGHSSGGGNRRRHGQCSSPAPTVTVCCAEGDIGHVYDGALAFDVSEVNLSDIPRPKTEIMVNLGDPDLAFQTAMLPNDGVGLARMEFIINEFIGIHPMALADPDKVKDARVRAKIAQLTAAYKEPKDYFIERLAEGVGMIAAGFYPKPVIVRLSDFKSNEYAKLLGGTAFEPMEANPMIGFRGASRYAHPAYAAGFALECQAHEAGARGDGAHQSQDHGAFLPPRGRSPAGDRHHGRPWPQAGPERAGNLRHVRDPQQCDPDRRLRQIVRRLFHRLQRSHPAHFRGGPGFGNRGVRLRRTRSGNDRNAAPGSGGRPSQPSPCRDLR